jgi:hypothetical protein
VLASRLAKGPLTATGSYGTRVGQVGGEILGRRAGGGSGEKRSILDAYARMTDLRISSTCPPIVPSTLLAIDESARVDICLYPNHKPQGRSFKGTSLGLYVRRNALKSNEYDGREPSRGWWF